MADDDFKSADAKYTLHLINKLTRDFWVGKLEAQETLEQIIEKISKHNDRVRMEG
ncbi:hypothetical protein KSL4_0831 [Leuconostoc inhae]|uniref:Uncharacterized protein n=1 Tax=Leuconostoc inhae TaxID=178001 RepID=A0ABP2B762_9LACO|nr:hypothetical protein [Leuconostoc inhae]CUW12408.1 hypothetical protein KSL4_0831 [Leuconostoc inhae]